jgi:hypothetical protein
MGPFSAEACVRKRQGKRSGTGLLTIRSSGGPCFRRNDASDAGLDTDKIEWSPSFPTEGCTKKASDGERADKTKWGRYFWDKVGSGVNSASPSRHNKVTTSSAKTRAHRRKGQAIGGGTPSKSRNNCRSRPKGGHAGRGRQASGRG